MYLILLSLFDCCAQSNWDFRFELRIIMSTVNLLLGPPLGHDPPFKKHCNDCAASKP